MLPDCEVDSVLVLWVCGAPSPADGDRQETADGDRQETADGDRQETADGGRQETADGDGQEMANAGFAAGDGLLEFE